MQIRLMLPRSMSLTIMVTYMTHVSIQSLQRILNLKKNIYCRFFTIFIHTSSCNEGEADSKLW